MRFTAIYPYDPLVRSRIRSYRTLSILAAKAPTAVYYPGSEAGKDGFPVPDGVTLHAIRDTTMLRLVRFACAMGTRRSLSFAFYRNALKTALRSEVHDLVFAERIPLPSRLVSATPIVYDTVDRFRTQVASLHEDAKALRRLGYGYDMHTIAAEQVRYCNASTLVLCTTDSEAKGLRSDGVQTPIQSFFHRSQTDWTDHAHAATEMREALSRRRRVINGRRRLASFHGRSSYPANIAAVRFIENSLAKALDDTAFLIFGEQWAERREANISYLGRQANLSLLGAADFGVFPLSTAVGIPNKVIECLAYGLPIVISPALHAILPEWIKDNLRERIHRAEIQAFAECIRSRESQLVRSDIAAEYFRSIYSAKAEASERELGDSIARLSTLKRQAQASWRPPAGQPAPLIAPDLRAASFDGSRGH
ncbi:MAG: glycosyltransferase [Opitutaceae bacterium]